MLSLFNRGQMTTPTPGISTNRKRSSGREIAKGADSIESPFGLFLLRFTRMYAEIRL